MRKFLLFITTVFITISVSSQESKNNIQQNMADKMLSSDSKLTIGGYGQIDFNQPFGSNVKNNGTLDVHRLVMLFGYSFSDRTTFITEIEFEHVSEVFVEQAFLQHRLTNSINFRAGLMLIPMGIINEYHEPPSYNGVERPVIDSYLAPTTWREVGLGFNGVLPSSSLKYQIYVVNGFKSYDKGGTLNGANALRKGRQKGAESFMSSPNLTFRTEYFGLRGLNIGLSAYFGKTSSALFAGIEKDDDAMMAMADSSVVGVAMLGLDARYSTGGLQIRGQFYYTSLSNTDEYNIFTADGGINNDLGSKMSGYYIEAAYNLLKGLEGSDYQLLPFIRYSAYNTHVAVEGALGRNMAYEKSIITTGLGLKLSPGAMLKCDIQFMKSGVDTGYNKTLNAGVGIMF